MAAGDFDGLKKYQLTGNIREQLVLKNGARSSIQQSTPSSGEYNIFQMMDGKETNIELYWIKKKFYWTRCA